MSFDPYTILDAVKKHGVSAVFALSVFVYLKGDIDELKENYKDCIQERINDFRLRLNAWDGNTPIDHNKQYAVLPTAPIVKEEHDRKKKIA